MIAAVPQIIVDVGVLSGVITAFGAATALLWRFWPVRWLRNQIGEALAGWLKRVIEEVLEPIRLLVEDARHRLTYHLGSNDTTPPIHQRISRLEERLGLDPIQQQQDPPLFGPHGEPRDEQGHDWHPDQEDVL